MALTGTISDDLKAAPDAILTAQALPNATSALSGIFLGGKTQDALEIVVEANTAISIADTFRLAFEIFGAVTRAGSYAKESTIYDETASGGAITFDAGDTIAVIALNRTNSVFNKVNIITTADESSEKVDVYIRRVSR